MNIQTYLNRISYKEQLTVTAQTLRHLQFSHLTTVPFENLSIHAGEPITLAPHALFNKIVQRRRGGFCYEANGLFAALLRALGFEVRLLSAGVANKEGVFGPPFDHMALLVELADRWLVDVGFGDSFLWPLPIDKRDTQEQGRFSYRILPSGNQLLLQRRDSNSSEWQPQYRFTLQAYNFPDYADMCRYHQESPESPFTQRRICSRATLDGGRLTLRDNTLITTSPDGTKQQKLLGDSEYTAVLHEQFGIVMDE